MTANRANLLDDTKKHRLNSDEGEVWFTNHLKIDNTNLSPDQVADKIIESFGLVANEKDEKEYRFGGLKNLYYEANRQLS